MQRCPTIHRDRTSLQALKGGIMCGIWGQLVLLLLCSKLPAELSVYPLYSVQLIQHACRFFQQAPEETFSSSLEAQAVKLGC